MPRRKGITLAFAALTIAIGFRIRTLVLDPGWAGLASEPVQTLGNASAASSGLAARGVVTSPPAGHGLPGEAFGNGVAATGAHEPEPPSSDRATDPSVAQVTAERAKAPNVDAAGNTKADEERQRMAQEELDYHRRRIEKSPDSPDAHFEHAQYLIGLRDYGQAEQATERSLKLKPDHEGAKNLRRDIDKVAAGTTATARTLAAAAAIVGSSLIPLEPLELIVPIGSTAEEEKRRVRQANETRRRELLMTYADTERYQAEHAEMMRTHLISKFAWDADAEGATRQFEVLSKEYPQSPYVPFEYASALIYGGGIDEAWSVVERAGQRFPRDMNLRVLRDLLLEARAGKQAHHTLWSELRFTLGLMEGPPW